MDDKMADQSLTAGTWEQGVLMATPDPSPSDRRAPVARWLMSLAEPLLSTEWRVDLDKEMAAFCGANQKWSAYWFAGYINDIVSTLPPEDPWRHLSATIDLAMISAAAQVSGRERITFDNPRGRPAPRDTGAVFPDGRGFGTKSDSSDLLMTDIGPSESDIGLAALSEPLSPVSAALAGFATADVDLFHSVLTEVWRQLHFDATDEGIAGPDAGTRYLGAVAPVLRRFIHRRRIYTGPDDPFPMVAGFSWMARADRLVAGRGRTSAEPGLAAEGALVPGTYHELRL